MARNRRAHWRSDCAPSLSRGYSRVHSGARADRLLGVLRALSGNVALFSHGQFGAALAARWIELAVEEARHFALSPASLSILGYESGHPTVPVIALWNAHSEQ